jgi:uncharacterized protein (DUF58 family)
MKFLRSELEQKVRRIEVTAQKMMNEVLSGNYKSKFRGQGIQFSDHKVYTPGDDIRHIDWKVSARNRDPMVKQYEEERELNLFIVVDISGSQDFGTGHSQKRIMAAELGAMLSLAASKSGDKTGLMICSDHVQKLIPPKKGRAHVQRIVFDILNAKPVNADTDFTEAFDKLGHLLRHKSVVVLISDFLDVKLGPDLDRLAKKHELIAICTRDLAESKLNTSGWLPLEDAESGLAFDINASSKAVRSWLELSHKQDFEDLQKRFRNLGATWLEVQTHEDYAEQLVRFFNSRRQRR